MNDLKLMSQALRLAKKGAGLTSPNPMVGAVIVKDDTILATGYHKKFGAPHAETDALSKLNHGEAYGATCVVTLEPCCHQGKTPPCTDLIIKSGIKRVVIGMRDPNPLVSGKGIRQLEKAGIEVVCGVRENECLELNKAFVKYMTQKLPYVTVKIAQTLDGYIALTDRTSKWISSEFSRKHVQRLRREQGAVLVGIGTVLSDDPLLTIRSGKRTPLLRIVLDSRLRIPETARILSHPDPQNTIVVCCQAENQRKIEVLRKKNIQVYISGPDSNGQVDLQGVLEMLAQKGITSLLVEGGASIASAFLKRRLADRLLLFIAPRLFGGGLPSFQDLGVSHMKEAVQFHDVRWKRSGPDMLFDGRLACLRV